jgi:predicted glutamine amidotransferase
MTQVGTVIVHLRKATIGVNDVTNTHPFVRAGVSFCHNGSIRSFPNPEPPRHHEGDTDSEKYFLRIIDRVLLNAQQSLQALGASLESVIADIQAGGDWTSLTCLMKTQEGLLIKYLWNESHPMTEAGKLNDYYTFYKGTKGGATILCSEQLPVDGVVWESLANGTLMTVPSAQAHI